jgi:hypothetical protein
MGDCAVTWRGDSVIAAVPNAPRASARRRVTRVGRRLESGERIMMLEPLVSRIDHAD